MASHSWPRDKFSASFGLHGTGAKMLEVDQVLSWHDAQMVKFLFAG